MMTKARLDGFTMLIVGCLFFTGIGVLMAYCSSLGTTDFGELYYASRGALEHHDPYRPGDVEDVYRAANGSLPDDPGVAHTKRLILFVCSNLPTTLLITAPLAAMPWKLAVGVWMLLLAACFSLACNQIWRFGADSMPRFYGGLLFLLSINSGLFLCAGNSAGLAVGLSVLAVCCFLRDRFVLLGVVGLALALAMKPHDAGPIWLYFLLVGGVQRKRALQTLALTAVLAIAAVIWLSHVAPHWLPEYQSNMHTVMSAGGRDNPGPTTQGGRGIGQIISLQAPLSLLFNDPRICDGVAWLLCGPLLVLWCFKVLRSGYSLRSAWFALAAVSALAMLPIYHRTYDARLLVLAIPACAILWNEHRPRGRWALALTIAAIVLTGDIFWIALFEITGYSGRIVGLGIIPPPLSLLALSVFFLYVYVHSPREGIGREQPS